MTPEMAVWPPNREYLYLWNYDITISTTTPSAKKLTPGDATTTDNRKLQHRRFGRQSCNLCQSSSNYYCTHSPTLFFTCTWSENLDLSLEFYLYLTQFQRYKYVRSRFGRHFRLSVIIGIT